MSMEYKVGELEGALLDAAVAKAEETYVLWGEVWCERIVHDTGISYRPFQPSTQWEDAGPIIERERITIKDALYSEWHAHTPTAVWGYGETPLTAAMRAYVASRFGETVELP